MASITKPCCAYVNENLAKTVVQIEETLTTALTAIGTLVEGPGVDINVREAKALEAYNTLLDQSRAAYQKILDSKCEKEKCCESATEAINTIAGAYAAAFNSKLNNTSLTDGGVVDELGQALELELAANQKDLDLITSEFDCKKKCEPYKKQCRVKYRVDCPKRRCGKRRSYKKYTKESLSSSSKTKDEDPCNCKK